MKRKQCAVRRGGPATVLCFYFLLTVSSPFEVHLLFISSIYVTRGTRALAELLKGQRGHGPPGFAIFALDEQ